MGADMSFLILQRLPQEGQQIFLLKHWGESFLDIDVFPSLIRGERLSRFATKIE